MKWPRILVDVVLGVVGLFASGLLGLLLAARYLVPYFIRIAIEFRLPIGALALFGQAAGIVGAGCAIGSLFAWKRPASALVLCPAASLLYLCATAAALAGLHANAALIASTAAFKAITVLSFWLPLALRSWSGGRFASWSLAVHGASLASVLAVCVVLLPVATVARVEPLRPNIQLPRFGEQSAVAHALSEGAPPAEDPAKRANRDAVLEAAARMRGNPCDRSAYFELRRALLVFLNNHVEQWYRSPVETVTIAGGTVNAARQLDGPALVVVREAFAAGIIRFDELSDGVRRELSFGHIGPANPGSPEVVAFACTR